MATLEDLGFFGRPIGQNAPVGVDELGNPVYRNALSGREFGMDMGAQDPQQRAAAYIDRVRGIEGGGNALTQFNRPTAGVQARNALTALAQGALQGVTAPGRAARGEPVTYGDAYATALDYGLLGAPMAAPEGALRANSFRAYHGSPHDFDEFRMDRIGTGEGAQAYGHGLYFAESEGVARSYRDDLARRQTSDSVNAALTPELDAQDALYARLEDLGLDPYEMSSVEIAAIPDESVQSLYRRFSEAEAARLQIARNPNTGRMYEVQINADPDTFLDWDAPLSEQSPAVRQTFQRFADENPEFVDPEISGGQMVNPTGQDFLGAYSEFVPHDNNDVFNYRRQFTADMQGAGIPGIRYRDAGSRGLDGAEGTRNFVVFDDAIIDIIRKYGVAGAAPMLGMTVPQLQSEMDAQGVTE